MVQQSKGQKETIARVMHEFEHGELESGRSRRPVKNRRQAIAIALNEAGSSRTQSAPEKREAFSRTKAKEVRGETAER